MNIEKITHKEWLEKGKELFGNDLNKWRFVCPACGHIASIKDWKDAGARPGQIAFSCIGRNLGTKNEAFSNKKGSPCNYAGGGLIGLNPIRVEFDDGSIQDTFAFAGSENK